jgi:hypothetical protein
VCLRLCLCLCVQYLNAILQPPPGGRYNRLASCRICQAAKLALGTMQCPSRPPSVSLSFTKGHFNLTVVHFTSPDDGFVLVSTKTLSQGGWTGEDRMLDSPVGSQPYFFAAQGLGPGNYSIGFRLVTHGRRIMAQTETFFFVDSKGTIKAL